MVFDDDTANDAEIARALSARFAAEELSSSTYGDPAAAARRREQEAKDAAYAASLARQDSALASTARSTPPPDDPPVVMAVPEPATAGVPESAPNQSSRILEEELRAAEAFGLSMTGYEDPEEMERKRAQEISDAEYAARLAEEENARAPPVAPIGGSMTEAEVRRRKRRRKMSTFFSLLLAFAMGFLLFVFLRRAAPGGISFDPADWFGGDWESGYHNSGSKGRNNAWISSTKGFEGLELRVLNNLDDKWQDLFATVMTEWDEGDPDAVSFQIERIDDSSCRTRMGALVVCNGDYGRTTWRGINELAISNGYIISSVAKLNDRYLDNADDATRQYVCCHEVGHGLGLGHTDEAMYNADLGECMDYTVRPQNNKSPGQANFELLERMYGNVDGTSDREELQEEGFNRKRVRRRVLDAAASTLDDAEGKDKWRLVHQSPRTEHYERDAGNGVTVRRTLLLV